jgi:hypothetical protein
LGQNYRPKSGAGRGYDSGYNLGQIYRPNSGAGQKGQHCNNLSKSKDDWRESDPDRKIFLDQAYASFSGWDFGFEFAGPCGIWNIRQIAGEIFRESGKFAAPRSQRTKFIFLKIVIEFFPKKFH